MCPLKRSRYADDADFSEQQKQTIDVWSSELFFIFTREKIPKLTKCTYSWHSTRSFLVISITGCTRYLLIHWSSSSHRSRFRNKNVGNLALRTVSRSNEGTLLTGLRSNRSFSLKVSMYALLFCLIMFRHLYSILAVACIHQLWICHCVKSLERSVPMLFSGKRQDRIQRRVGGITFSSQNSY